MNYPVYLEEWAKDYVYQTKGIEFIQTQPAFKDALIGNFYLNSEQILNLNPPQYPWGAFAPNQTCVPAHPFVESDRRGRYKSFQSIGQSQAISNWKKLHPQVHIFSQHDFDQLSEDKKLLIAENVIVIQSNELSWSDIVAFEGDQVQKGMAYSIEPEHAEEIKFWIASHPNAKVLTREYYDELTPERKQQYLQNDLLILGGNILTLSDIERYEENH